MSDPFQDSVDAEEAPAGPFRTAEPTGERRLERAREESLARVAKATAAAVEAERLAVARRQRWAVVALAASAVVTVAVIVGSALGDAQLQAFICPAIAALLSTALFTWKHRALTDAWSSRREPPPP